MSSHVNRPPEANTPPNGKGVHRPEALTAISIVTRWIAEGPLVRVPTGIVGLDELCRGGLPVPWRGVIIGAPSSGKTALAVTIADNLARIGVAVGMLAVDEDPEDVLVRFAQMAGFTIADAELREPVILHQVVTVLGVLPVRFYGAEFTIEAAAKDLATWATSEARRAALFVDSLQTAHSEGSNNAKSPRELVEANVRAIRSVTAEHRLLTIATSEANRASYRGGESGEQQADLAAGAESRSIEFGAQTLLMLRTPKGHPDVVHVRVAKNRRARIGELWLQLDRDRHMLAECADPAAGGAVDRDPEVDRQINSAKVNAQAKQLAEVARKSPGLSTRDLRAAARIAGHRWGNATFDAVKKRLVDGLEGMRLVNRGEGKADKWHLVSLEVVRPATEVDDD